MGYKKSRNKYKLITIFASQKDVRMSRKSYGVKQNAPKNTHDEHLALGMIVAYGAGMLLMALFFAIYTAGYATPNTSQAYDTQYPTNTSADMIQQNTYR